MRQEDMIKSFNEFKEERFDEQKVEKIFCPHCGSQLGWIKKGIVAEVTVCCSCGESCGIEIDKNGKVSYIHGNDNLLKEEEK